ncbi:acetate/propionate family kinase [soil metagenome]
MRLLTVNAGSTSVKLSVLESDRDLRTYGSVAAAEADRTAWADVDAVAHRVVHGGHRTAAVVVDDAVRDELAVLTELAPLHQPPSLGGIDTFRRLLPSVPHVACFDTTFHAMLPEAARTYALPERLRDKVRVYGFHGLSHAWAVRRVAELAPDARRVIVAHLGGGGSLCGVLDGRSRTTTMGFTPLDGLVMATRSGSVDPGALLWLAKHTDEDLDHVLENESGLLGLCGDADLRDVLRRRDAGDAEARLAVDVYVERFVRLLGGCVAALEGIDVLVFTGGIGEHSDQLRTLVAARLAWLGVRVGEARTDGEVTGPGSAVRTFVVASREDRQMYGETRTLLESG